MKDATGGGAAPQDAAVDGWVQLRTLRPTGLAARLSSGGRGDAVEALLNRHIMVQLPRPVRISVLSLKGGVGKSFTTLGVAAQIAATRGTPTSLIDTDTDAATAGIQVGGGGSHSWWDLLRAASQNFAEARRNPSQYATRLPKIGLHIYPAPPQAEMRARMIGRQYGQLLRVLGYQYWVSLVDCGTSLTSDISQEVLRSSDAVILATSTEKADLIKAVETHQLLSRMGHDRLARSATVAVWMRAGGDRSKAAEVEDTLWDNYFHPGYVPPNDRLAAATDTSVQEIVAVPHDPVVHGGAEINPTSAGARTKDAWKAIAASAVHAAYRNLAGL